MCIMENLSNKIQNFIFYKPLLIDKQTIEKDQTFTIQFQSQQIFKINQLSKLGWLGPQNGEKNKNCIFYTLDPKNSYQMMRKIQVQTPLEFIQNDTDKKFQIQCIFEIKESIYLIKDKRTANFWIFDSRKEGFSDCIQRINPEIMSQHKNIFQYHKYSFKTFGNFIIYQYKLKQLGQQKQNRRALTANANIWLGIKNKSLYYFNETSLPPYFSVQIKNQLIQAQLCITVTWKMSPKEIYLHLLLSINQNFDDDLLSDSLSIMIDDN